MAASLVAGDVGVSGLCGIVSLDGSRPSEDAARAMAAAAGHRATGTTSVVAAPTAVLAQLSREVGESVSAYGGPDVLVVADARIDNEVELRRALARHRLDDGEVTRGPAGLIAAAYRAWGSGCAARIIGDFAFVIWDVRRRAAVVARDPMALRSLYYRVEPARRLLVATEIKQLLTVAGVPRRVNETAVAADMVAHFGRPEWSFYEGIDQLAPGHVLEVNAQHHTARRFWDVDTDFRLDVGMPEAVDALQRTFVDAVACRLDGDRPAGILLSGGVDSGSVAATAGWLARTGAAPTPPLHALSWAFTELPQCDERHISRIIVEAYDLPATDVPADEAGPLAGYPDHLPDRDDPFLGAFQPLIEHSLVAAREAGLRSVLGGDRGDLLIGDTGLSYLRMVQSGHRRQLRAEIAEHRRALGDARADIARRHFVHAVTRRLASRTPRQWAGWAAQRGRRLLSGDPGAGFDRPPWLRESLVRRTAIDEVATTDIAVPEGLGYARTLRYRSIFTPLHVRGVAWSERTYARYGLGFADPFSDRRMAELCVALPPSLINRPGDQSKPLMRAAMRGIMPEPARVAVDKIVPTPLFDRGLRDRSDLVIDLLRSPQVAEHGWVDGEALRSHFEGWLAGAPLRAEFWWTLQVELWLRTYWT